MPRAFNQETTVCTAHDLKGEFTWQFKLMYFIENKYSFYRRSNILTEPSAPTEANMSRPPPARLNAISYT